MALLAAMTGTLLVVNETHTTYVVKIDGQVLGKVKQKSMYTEALESCRARNHGTTPAGISLEAEKKNNLKILSRGALDELMDSYANSVYALSVGGVEMAAVKSRSDYQQVLDGLLQYYIPKDANSKIHITSEKILEKVSVVRKPVASEKSMALSPAEAIRKIAAGRGTSKCYTIKNGDTIWDIAIANDTSVEDIETANPGIKLDKIKIGQQLKLTVAEPYVNVRITAEINSMEKIPYDSKQIKDKKLRRGRSRVKIRGRYGLANISKRVVINNGDVINEDVLASKTIQKPIDEVVAVGSSNVLMASAGSFIRPSRGMMTSPFGRRWGKMHEGIDLASPTGSPIHAACEGKVTFVGRKNGYGLCVMISHGNGLQTLYGHTSRTYVHTGERVQRGERIAAVGSTGHSTGPHLHFEVRKNGRPVNPLLYLHR